MAVVSVTTGTVKPDRFEDFLEVMRKGKAITEKCGGRNVRLLSAVVAGEATGGMALISEADDFAALGAVTDKFMADPEGVALMSSMNTTDGSVTGGKSTIWVEVPL